MSINKEDKEIANMYNHIFQILSTPYLWNTLYCDLLQLNRERIHGWNLNSSLGWVKGIQSLKKSCVGETSQNLSEKKYQHIYQIKKNNMWCSLTVHLKQFPKHKIDHKNIGTLSADVNYTKGIIKEAQFVGCSDPAEEIKSTELLNLE